LDLEDFERELMERLTPLGFHSLDEAKGDLHLLDTERNLDEQLAAAEVCLTEARSRLETAQSELELAPDRSLGTIHDGISETTKKKNHLQSKIQDIYYTLERQREIEGAYLETLEAIREQEKVCSRATDDLGMLQSGDLGQVMTRLRRFMLERLLQKANEHLELLSGRYSLRPLSEEGLGIKVLDALQGNAFRSLKTLSGGESFLASLCLALALSGMASRDRKIESLFLDEGFGALDDEMLYKVTAALKALRSNGKMVGIISHVKRLADEIPTQIRVEKLPDGSSTISVVA
jgi:exonuclease SbcC